MARTLHDWSSEPTRALAMGPVTTPGKGYGVCIVLVALRAPLSTLNLRATRRSPRHDEASPPCAAVPPREQGTARMSAVTRT